jgi:hypothetical protein
LFTARDAISSSTLIGGYHLTREWLPALHGLLRVTVYQITNNIVRRLKAAYADRRPRVLYLAISRNVLTCQYQVWYSGPTQLGRYSDYAMAGQPRTSGSLPGSGKRFLYSP